MPKYKHADITCYCGRRHEYVEVGQPVRCACGVTLHTEQHKNGDGRVWGSTPSRNGAYYATYKARQSGTDSLELRFRPD